MTTTNITPGTKFTFTPTGKSFEIATITDKKVSWYVGFEYKGGAGKNKLKMATTSRQIFEQGLRDGTYIIN